MGRTRKGLAHHKAGHTPQYDDYRSLYDAIYEDYGSALNITIYQDLVGDLIVVAEADYASGEGPLIQVSDVRRCMLSGESLPFIIVQCGHAVYHQLDRLAARAAAK